MSQTTYEKLGGYAAVNGIVKDFYERVMASDSLKGFFVGVDMDKQATHQTKFISSLLGGPVSYTNEQLQIAHQHLKINDTHFDDIQALLDATLKDNLIPQEVRAEIVAEFEARRGVIVT
ncbi:MAG: group 1 truncated hemoglobin [Rhodospirillales bacterium]|nr:group 1 truncated hemoglobin [Rhodospirillales bacterium]